VLHAFHTGNATHLSRWAADLSTSSETTTFFNFLASHDGIGATPARGILGDDEVQSLVDLTHAHGGHVSFRDNPDGTRSVYELNISYFDALSNPSSDEPQATQVARFIASQAIILALAGVPGIYVHSMLGSRNYHAGVELTGRFRSINREKFERAALEAELADPNSLRSQVFRRYAHLLRARAGQVAFCPDSSQSIVSASDALFVLLRTSPDSREQVLCVHNVSGATQPLEIAPEALSIEPGTQMRDLLSGEAFTVDWGGALAITVAPYQVLWLRVGPTAHEDNTDSGQKHRLF
jgi:sucrose phosphorylase